MLDIISTPSPNFKDRHENVHPQYIILHYTEMSPVESALERLCDPKSNVSAHYLITEAGQIHQLVDPSKRAWHAGISSWKGVENINDISIGIELDHPGHKDPKPYSKKMIYALLELLTYLCKTYKIPKDQIWGHSDIAPLRKVDPGEFFDWSFLHLKGFGTWFDPKSKFEEEINLENAIKMLQEIGYSIESKDDFGLVLSAFQRHFYPENVTGELDLETYRRLGSFLSK